MAGGLKVDGILNVNKPGGKTSFSLVAMVRRLSGVKRVGHAGTLDPMASGVLPICLGQGTRVVEFLQGAPKAYRAEIELGVATDTYDASGQVTRRGDFSGVSQQRLRTALAAFDGLIQQIPPMYSAVKYQGKPLYKLARAGISVERRSRLARIDGLELIDWQPPVATIEVVCGKGTYIRSLAHDLGEALGCGAHLKSLVRLRYGRFDIEDAVSLSQLEAAFHYGYWQHFVYPIDSVLLYWSAMIVGDDAEQSIRNGCPIVMGEGDRRRERTSLELTTLAEPTLSDRCRAYVPDGRFLGVLRFNYECGQWRPEKVFL